MSFESPESQEIAEASARNRFPNVPIRLLKQMVLLHSAVDQVIISYNDNDYGAACDQYTNAARGFASQMLEERVKRYFEPLVDSTSGKPFNSSLDDKKHHAQQIRNWLLPWNLGFRRTGTNDVYQIHASAAASQGYAGTYVATKYGGTPQVKLGAWKDLKTMVMNCELVDALKPRAHDQQIDR